MDYFEIYTEPLDQETYEEIEQMGTGKIVDEEERKRFVCYWWFTGWDCISLGFHICLSIPNAEVHLPFGFIRVGWEWQGSEEVEMLEKKRPEKR